MSTRLLKKILFSISILLFNIVVSSCSGKSAEDYNTVFEFFDGHAIAIYNGDNNQMRYVIINDKYEPVIEDMKFITRISKDFWIAETLSGQCARIDKQLTITPFPKKFSEFSFVPPSRIWTVDSDQNMVLFDLETGKQLSRVYPKCELDQKLDNGSVVLKKVEKPHIMQSLHGYGYAIIDLNGKEIVPFGRFSFIGDFKNGLATFSATGYGVKIGMKASDYGYGNDKVMKAKWFEVGDRGGRHGLRISDNFKQGYINEKGEIVIPQQFVYAQPFDEDGYAIVGGPLIHTDFGSRREYSKIDKTGQIVKTDLNVKKQSDFTVAER